MSASSTASSWKSVYRLHCDPGRSVPMTALASPTTLGSSGGTKRSPHDTYSTSSVPMRSMPSSSYSSPCSEKMRRAAEVRSSFIVASSSSSAIEAGRTASLPTLAPTQRRVMRVGIGAACIRARPRSGAFLALIFYLLYRGKTPDATGIHKYYPLQTGSWSRPGKVIHLRSIYLYLCKMRPGFILFRRADHDFEGPMHGGLKAHLDTVLRPNRSHNLGKPFLLLRESRE